MHPSSPSLLSHRLPDAGAVSGMGQCLEKLNHVASEEEMHLILRTNPFLRRLPYIADAAELSLGLVKMPGEFCWSRELSPAFVAELCYRGFVPMAELVLGGHCILLPKLHYQRCVLHFAQLRVPKKARQRASAFELTVDTCFDEVVRGCQAQHGDGCWLHKPLVAIFRALHDAARKQSQTDDRPVASNGRSGAAHGPLGGGAASRSAPHSRTHHLHPVGHHHRLLPVPPPAAAAPLSPTAHHGVRFHSFELWRKGKLVAGELGYSVGACYTSLSGFYTIPSAGTMQCVATAKLLQEKGFVFWDLGMELPYKLHLGARCIPRDDFLNQLAVARDLPPNSPHIPATSVASILRASPIAHTVAPPVAPMLPAPSSTTTLPAMPRSDASPAAAPALPPPESEEPRLHEIVVAKPVDLEKRVRPEAAHGTPDQPQLGTPAADEPPTKTMHDAIVMAHGMMAVDPDAMEREEEGKQTMDRSASVEIICRVTGGASDEEHSKAKLLEAAHKPELEESPPQTPPGTPPAPAYPVAPSTALPPSGQAADIRVGAFLEDDQPLAPALKGGGAMGSQLPWHVVGMA